MNQRVSLPHQFLLGARHLALHAILCFLLGLFFGWLEIEVHIAMAEPGAANEFVGMYLVLWIYAIGPIACLLAAPAHLVVYIKKRQGIHLYSIAASAVSCISVWTFFWVLSRDTS